MEIHRALYIGRFQPFHLGHFAALKYILREEKEVVLAIGSSQHSHTIENPFTLGERIEMIYATLKEEGIYDRVVISSVPDVERHYIWVELVLQNCPKFNVVYTNDPLTTLLFMEKRYEVKPIPFYEREKYEAKKNQTVNCK